MRRVGGVERFQAELQIRSPDPEGAEQPQIEVDDARPAHGVATHIAESDLGDTRECLIELTFAGEGKFSDAQVAASIVHEGVHARLLAMGIAGHPGCEAREERLCRKAELELGMAVPDGQAVIERALSSLTLGDVDVAPNVDWRVAEQRVADADAAAAARRRGDGGR